MQSPEHGNSMKSNLDISLMEKIVEPDNLSRAFKKVKSNKGAAGVDAKDIEATRLHLKEEGQKIIELIREGKYKPQAVRRVDIPKTKRRDKKARNSYSDRQGNPTGTCTEAHPYFRKTV